MTSEAAKAWAGIKVLFGEERTNYPLTLSVDDLGDGFCLTAQVEERIEAQRVCGYMECALRNLVKALEEEPHKAVRVPEVIPEKEYKQIVEEWNTREAEYPSQRCIHELVEAQVEKTLQAAAVEYEGTILSYGELNRRANQLAHYLKTLEVKPDERVAICAERSVEMVVALLAVLKAGGAYVSLDPAYPVERLQHMIKDSKPVVLLTQSHVRERLGELPSA